MKATGNSYEFSIDCSDYTERPELQMKNKINSVLRNGRINSDHPFSSA